MPAMNDQTQLLGLFKEIYPNGVVDAFAFVAKLAKRFGYSFQEAGPGNKYHQPEDLQLEHGFSYSAAGSTPSGAGQYLAPSAGKMEDAQAEGAQQHGRFQVSYEALSRAAAAGRQAFEPAIKRVMKRAGLSALKRFEVDLLHGQRGWGQVNGTNPGNAASRVVTITDDSWSAGIWAGSKNMTVDLWNSALGAKVSTGSSGTADAISISSVNPAAKQLTLSLPNATDQTLSLANVNIFPETATPTNTIAGVDKWSLLDSTVGSFFNINSTNFELWQANQYSTAVGIISMAKVLEAASMVVPYGILTGELLVIIPPRAYEVLNSDQAALRKYDSSYTETKGSNGTKSLQFVGQMGALEIMSHPFQKDGRFHIVCPDEAVRVGSQELDFVERNGNKLILESSTSPGSEMRSYMNQQLFFEQPRHLVLGSGLTY